MEQKPSYEELEKQVQELRFELEKAKGEKETLKRIQTSPNSLVESVSLPINIFFPDTT